MAPTPKRKKWHDPIVILTFCTVILALASVAVAGYQAWTFREMSRNDQRAWVGQALPVDQSKPTVTEGAVLPVAIVFLNFGRTPALELQHRLAYDIQPSGQRLDPVYPPVPTLRSKSILQPGGRSTVLFSRTPPLTRPEADSITSRTKTLYFYGEATYTDVFDRPFSTTFAYRFVPSMAAWVFNDTYNAAK